MTADRELLTNARIDRSLSTFALCMMGCALVLSLSGCDKGKPAPQAPLVEVVDVVQKDVPVYVEWVGSVEGSVNATIRAQVSGYLMKQNYREGDFVKKGKALFEIDPRTFQAALDQAEGNLANAQAQWDTAKANLKRIRPLAEKKALSQRDLDNAVGQELSAAAAVQSAKAAVDKARLDLDFTKITSPIDGVAGLAQAQIGNLVGPNSTTPLTTVATVDPIKVYIPLSEQQYLWHVEKQKQNKNRTVTPELFLSDGSLYPHKGQFALADNQIDPKTGTIKVAALFPNPGNILRPGLFARVRAHVETKQGALLVPQRSVSEIQGRYQVAVVGSDNKIDIRTVKAAERVDTLWVIDEGLKPGERVVSEGVQKVRPGMTVRIKTAGPEQKKPEEAKPAGAPTGAPAKSEEQPAAAPRKR
jgi:membrane fusion protein (multidrug efflux system)